MQSMIRNTSAVMRHAPKQAAGHIRNPPPHYVHERRIIIGMRQADAQCQCKKYTVPSSMRAFINDIFTVNAEYNTRESSAVTVALYLLDLGQVKTLRGRNILNDDILGRYDCDHHVLVYGTRDNIDVWRRKCKKYGLTHSTVKTVFINSNYTDTAMLILHEHMRVNDLRIDPPAYENVVIINKERTTEAVEPFHFIHHKYSVLNE